jgi:putative hydrolase
MELAEDFDPTNAEAMKELLTTGALLPERTEEQNRALERLEGMLALVEGWVDHVTGLATARLPKSGALGEAIRRRRASGGPAEHAFSTLVGLELRPRKLREASALWAEIHRELGSEARDELWRHPDTLPHLDDLDNPGGFLQRIAHPPADDDFDQALRELLDEETPES